MTYFKQMFWVAQDSTSYFGKNIGQCGYMLPNGDVICLGSGICRRLSDRKCCQNTMDVIHGLYVSNPEKVERWRFQQAKVVGVEAELEGSCR